MHACIVLDCAFFSKSWMKPYDWVINKVRPSRHWRKKTKLPLMRLRHATRGAISIELFWGEHSGGEGIGWAGISTSFYLTHLDWVSRTHKHTATTLAAGFNPCSSCVHPTVHCRTPEIISPFADSNRMLILSHLLYCSVKSKFFLRLSSRPDFLKIHLSRYFRYNLQESSQH